MLIALLAVATHAHAAALRVLAPARSTSLPSASLCLVEHLSERLALCQGVDLVQGDRAGKVNAWLAGGAFDLTEAQQWQRLSSLVAIDALVTVAAPDESAEASSPATAPAIQDRTTAYAVEVRIFRAGGITRLRGELPIGSAKGGSLDLPRAVSAIAERLGRELKLGDADIKTLATVRIDDDAAFRIYYGHLTASSSWPTNPYVPAVLAVAGLPKSRTHWADDAAIVRVAASYIQSVNHGRQSDKLSTIAPIVRSPLLRLMGTTHEDETYPLLRLPRGRAGEAMLADIELVLLGIAAPLAGDGEGKVNASADAKTNRGAASSPSTDARPGTDAGKAKERAKPPPAPTHETGSLTEDDLLDMTQQAQPKLGDAIARPNDLTARTGRADYTAEQRLGALRMLGVMRSGKAATLIERAADSPDRAQREAAAEALGALPGDAGLDVLARLATDGDARVLFVAARALAERGKPPADLAARCKTMLTQPEPYRTRAAEALARHALAHDAELRRQLAEDPSPTVRRAVRRASPGEQRSATARLAAVLTESDSQAIIDAIRGVAAAGPGAVDEPVRRHLIQLANDPDSAVSQAAREALWPLRPSEPLPRARFDLTVAEPYRRHQAVAQLKASIDPAARAELIAACGNLEPHTRLAALRALASLDPAIAAAPLAQALGDPHRLVRFHAAALLASAATPAQADAIRAAIPHQRDRAAALYLADALARAEGRPAPPSTQPRANLIDGPGNVVWLWGSLGYSPDSPFRHHFKPSHGNHVRDDAIHDEQKTGHAAGIAYVYNIGPMGEPGVSTVDPAAQEGWWIYLDDQLDTPNLPWIDAVDLMVGGIAPHALWPAGWRYFCEECGIDASRVNGQIKNLSAIEARAWAVWSGRRCVEARNRVYDYIKLKFGKLHPGFQVGQSVGRSHGVADFDLRFDFAFVRDQGDDPRRDVYDLIRHARTVWPRRRVVWHGQAQEVEDLWVIRHDFKTPSKLITGRQHRAYVHALSAWMAGADTGWAGTWVFRALNWDPASYAGAVVTPDDLASGGARLRAAVDMTFDGAEVVFRDRAALDKADRGKLALPPTDQASRMDEMLDGIEQPSVTDAAKKRVAVEKERMLLGFGIYGRHVLGLANLFASLPRHDPAPEALVIAPASNADERPARAAGDSAGADLLSAYDVLFDINDVTRLDLKRYRFITVSDPPALEDATIDAITQWLRQTPGVLYIHRDLTADNARQAGTPERCNGRLERDWPWERDVTITPAPPEPPEPPELPEAPEARAPAQRRDALELRDAGGKPMSISGAALASRITLAGKPAWALLSAQDAPALALWQHPDYRGAVVIDGIEGGGVPYRLAVRQALNELQRAGGVGLATDHSIGQLRVRTESWTAAVATAECEASAVTGADLLSGERDPVLGPPRGAALVAREFNGTYAVAANGVSVLCDRPIRKMEKTPEGMVIECDGLIQASSSTGKIEATVIGAPPLTPIKADQQVRWVVLGREDGITQLPIGDGKASTPASLIYLRSRAPVALRVKP